MERKRQLVLASVAVILVAVAVWLLQSPAAPHASSPPGPAPAGAPGSRVPAAQKGAVGEVDLESLDAERPEPAETDRNPFRFKLRPAPSPSPTAARGTVPNQAGTPGVDVPDGPPPPPRIPLKFIGVVHSEDPKFADVAVLSDGRGVYHGRAGEVIEGRYRIVKIGVESIELAYLDGRGSQTISKTGQ
jgi:hypothetical protein